MLASVLLLTTTLFVCVGADVVVQVDISQPKFITIGDKTQIVDPKVEVRCSPPGLCRSELKGGRFTLRTLPEIMRGQVKATSNCENNRRSARIEAPPLTSIKTTTLSPWKEFKEEIKASRNIPRRDRGPKVTSRRTKMTTTDSWTTSIATPRTPKPTTRTTLKETSTTAVTMAPTMTSTEEVLIETTTARDEGESSVTEDVFNYSAEELANSARNNVVKPAPPDQESENIGGSTTTKTATKLRATASKAMPTTPESSEDVETTFEILTRSTTTSSPWWRWR